MTSGTSRRTPRGSYGLAALWEETESLPRMGVGGQCLQLYFRAWYSLFASLGTSLLTIFTLAIALTLLGTFVLFVENAKGVLSMTEQAFVVNVYLKDEATPDAVTSLKRDIERFQGVKRIRYKSKQDALKEFKNTLGEYSPLLEGIESENPLPASYEVVFADSLTDTQILRAFQQQTIQYPFVDIVQYSEGAVSQVVALLKFIRTGGLFTMLGLCITTGFIIASTIMLSLYSHRDEIRIMRYIGAQEWTVRLPYVLKGFIQGVLGAALSIGVLYALFVVIKDRFGGSSVLRYLIPELQFISVGGVLLVILVGLSVGVIGSYLAVRRNVLRGE
jgi:cell division transport system permease protein